MAEHTVRYYLTETREVTKAEFVAAERKAGFHNTMGQPDEPGTAGFSAGEGLREIRGRVVYETGTDQLWKSICDVGDDFTTGRIDEPEALARLEELGCLPSGAEGHVARWKK